MNHVILKFEIAFSLSVYFDEFGVVQLQDLSQPKSEASAPDGSLVVSLLRHQVWSYAHGFNLV